MHFKKRFLVGLCDWSSTYTIRFKEWGSSEILIPQQTPVHYIHLSAESFMTGHKLPFPWMYPGPYLQPQR